jgi:AcrR family transcriptional regulator
MKPSAPRRRLLASERRQQIIDAVLRLVSEFGVAGATISRVADSAGIGVGTVYRYFDNQKEMLRSALEALSTEMTATVGDAYRENAIEQLREMGRRHLILMSARGGELARVWMEFIAANQQLGIRESVIDGHRMAMEAIRAVCDRGQAQGSIREDADLDLLTYQIFMNAWGEDMSVLMGLEGLLAQRLSTRALEQLLAAVTVQRGADESSSALGPVPRRP